jgi:WD40 repeat protein
LGAVGAGKILQKYKSSDPQVMDALRTSVYEGRERNRLEGHGKGVNSVSFSPDGKTLASSGSWDNLKG